MADNDMLNTVQPPAPSAQPSVSESTETQVQPQSDTATSTPAPSVSTQPTQPAQPADQESMGRRPAEPTPRGLHASIFEGVLKTLGGGPIFINKTDPATGATTREEVHQTKGQLGKSILAGAIAGMFGGMGARDEEGRHDPLKAAQQGFQASAAQSKERQAALQQTADEDISRRQMVMKNNMDLLHQQVAMTHMQHQELEQTADSNNKGILADAAEFDKNLSGADVNDPTKKAILGRGMTYKEALDRLHGNWSNTLAIVDGSQEIRGANGAMEVEPTYAVLSPSVTLKMSEQQAAAFAKFKPAYQNAYEATGGNLKIPLNRYVSDVHQLNSLNQTEAFFENAKDQLGIKGSPDFAAVARKGGQPVLDAVKDVENAIGQGGDPVDALRRLAGTGGGAQILKEMGITNDQVNNLVNDRDQKAALAKQGGMGEKAPAAQSQVDGLISSINSNPDMTPSDKKALMVDVPAPDKDGVVRMTQGQVAKVVARQDAVIASNKNIAEKNALANGDPEQMKKTASNIIEGDINNLTKVASMRGNARQNTLSALHDEAVSRGLDPTDYSEAAMEAKAEAVKAYAAAGKVGQQIASFRTFLGHTAEAADANEAWTRTNSPLLNRPLAWIAKNASNDPNYVRLKAALGAPAKEYMSFLNANRAEHESDINMMGTVLDPNSTPLQIHSALKELVKTADFRLGSLGKGYQSTVGTNFTGLLDPASMGTLKKFGVEGTAPAVAAPLPRGWAQGKPQTMIDKNMAKLYYAAAGKDKARTIDLAKKNGWLLQ